MDEPRPTRVRVRRPRADGQPGVPIPSRLQVETLADDMQHDDAGSCGGGHSKGGGL